MEVAANAGIRHSVKHIAVEYSRCVRCGNRPVHSSMPANTSTELEAPFFAQRKLPQQIGWRRRRRRQRCAEVQTIK